MRNTLDLSITVAPAATAAGAHWRLTSPPAAKNARSTPSKAPGPSACTVSSAPPKGSVRPAERSLASRRSSPSGKSRSSQDAAHRAAHDAGGADDGQAQAAAGSSERAPVGVLVHGDCLRRGRNASCSARTASSTRSLAMTQQILIGEVLIMSRLMPRSARVWNMRAATPGCVRMPAPMRLTLPMLSSVS